MGGDEGNAEGHLLGRGLAVANLGAVGAGRQLRAPIHDVADVDIAAGQPHRLNHPCEQLPRGTDERLALKFFLRARRLSHEHDPRIEAPHAEYDLLAGPDMRPAHRVVQHQLPQRRPADGLVAGRQNHVRRRWQQTGGG